jgi:hypothetical protein
VGQHLTPGPQVTANEPMLGVRVKIFRYVDASHPGWVECGLVDAFGCEHVFVEKVPVVTEAHLDAASSYPQSGVIACVALGSSESGDGRPLVHIDMQTPWGVQSLAGGNRFDVFPEQLVSDLGSLCLTSIMIWKDVELYERCLKDFASLTPLERDYFGIKHLDIHYEMEGGFEDYILSGEHTSELMWLKDALRRIGDIVSANIITELWSMNESQRSEMKPLCDCYFGRRDQRWQLLMRHLGNNGITIDEKP